MLGAAAGVSSREGVAVQGADAVETSFPGFFHVLDELGRYESRHDRGDRRPGRLGEEHRGARARSPTRLRAPRHRVPCTARSPGSLRESDVDLEDGEALARLALEHPITFSLDGRVEIAGEDVSTGIRAAEIDRLVPVVARHPEVREVMRERQRTLGSIGNTVIEGRDIGSVVAPQAEVKVFLVADESERVRRRSADRPGTSAESLASELRRRDERDAVNTQPAGDAVLLDTTDLTVDQVVRRIAELVEARR